MFEVLDDLYFNELIPALRLTLASDSLKGQGIHVLNSNGDPNNPKAWVGDFKIIEHLSATALDGSPTSHEVIDQSSAGTQIYGDSENITFWNYGIFSDEEKECDLMGNYHDKNTNTGHFSYPDSPYKGPMASNNDLIWAGAGDDIVRAKTGNDTVHGGTGNDILEGGTGNDLVYGEEDTDFLFGDAGDDTLDGGSGDDVIDGGFGNDIIIGGAGTDFAVYRESSSAVSVRLTDQSSSLGFTGVGELGMAQGDVLYSIEGLVGSNYNDTLVGNSQDNELWGYNGDDIINAGAGNDIIFGGNGNNTLIGGLGNDLVYGGEGADVMSGDGGTDVLRGGNGDDAYAFSNGSQVDRVIETGTSTGDMAFLIGIANIYVYKLGNDLILTANNDADQMHLVNWYENKGVDIVAFADTQTAYTAEYVASLALDITPTATSYTQETNLNLLASNMLDATKSESNVPLSGINFDIDIASVSC